MKRKFSKILGVGLTLALLASFLVTAAPVSAISSATVTVPAADDAISNDDAEYSIFFTINEELDGDDSATFSLPDTGDQMVITDSGVGTDVATLTVTAGSISVVFSGAGTYIAGVITFAVAAETATVEATADNTAGTWTQETGAPAATIGTDVTQPPTVAAPPGGVFTLPDATPAPGDDIVITDSGAGTDVATLTVTAGSISVVMSGAGSWTPATGVIAFAAIGETATVSATADNTAGTWAQTTGAPTAATGTDVNQIVVLGALAADGDTITITFPDDTILAATVTANATISASDGWVGIQYLGANLSGDWSYVEVDRTLTYTMGIGDRIGASAQVMINIILGITNPSTPDDYTLTVATSQEAAEESELYTITPPDITVPAGVVRVFNPSGIEFQPQTGNDAIYDAITTDAGDDWVIVIGEGTYTGPIPNTGGFTGLTIKGAAGADVIIEADMLVNGGGALAGEGFTLENVTIDGTLTLGAAADNANIVNVTFLGGQNSLVIDADADTPDIIDSSFAPEDGDTAITLNGEADITGSEFTLVDGATAISVAAGADGGTIDDNTFTGASGDGIILAGDTDVTDNVFDGLDWAIRVDGGTQVISGNTIQASDEIAIDIDGATGVVITANTLTGNNDDVLIDVDVALDADDVQVMFNDILDNAGDADGLLINNADTLDLNCTNNWWGDPDGPGADAFSDNVISAPFLTASVGDTGVLGTNVAAQELWDERTTAGVALRALVGGMEIVGAAQYAANPGADVAGTALAFWDVCVIDTNDDITEVTVRLYLPGVAADTEAWVWAAARGEWLECSDATPNLFGGFVGITVTDITIPTIEDLEELPFVLVDPSAATVLATAPVIATPESGDDTVSLTPTFAWGAVPGADAYYFQFADNANFVPPLLAKLDGDLGRLLVTAYAYRTELPYSTAYYWRVKAVSGSEATGDLAESAWTSAVFITMDEPEEPIPPVVIQEAPELPDITIEQPDITITSPDIIVPLPDVAAPMTPTWIYVIIAVGAVLVIALLVLIVRTRRVA